jgi:catechol 2,3-dioxygenase-like lactoylglutathione lyase family enzyme
MTETNERVRDIAHLGNVELLSPKPDKSLWYFRDVLGMEAVHVEGRSAYLRGYGDYAASTVKLTEAAHAGVGCVSWRAVSEQALDRRARDRSDGSRHRLGRTRLLPRPVVSLPRPRRPSDGDLLRRAEISTVGRTALHAEESADEVHRPRRVCAAYRPPGAALQRRRTQPALRRRAVGLRAA